LLYLTRDDLEALGIEPREVVDVVDHGLRRKGQGLAVMPPKLSLHLERESFAQVMAAALGDEGLGMKWVSVVPSNAGKGLPVISGLVLVCDPVTGLPEAVLEAGTVTAWRTGASVAVAARYLARDDVDTVGVLGCGVQGTAAAVALAGELPRLRVVRCHDPVRAAVDRFARVLGETRPDLLVQPCATPGEVTRGAGVVASAIPMRDAAGPVLGAGLLEPGAVAVALDYDAAWSAEAMAECERFYCDDTAQVLATKAAGVRLGGIPGEIAGDLGELAAGRISGRRSDAERLFCLNLGVAVEDVVTARLALARARELGVGRELPV
jgi:ornithine cyclodeaminase/alanine dehydrogenase